MVIGGIIWTKSQAHSIIQENQENPPKIENFKVHSLKFMHHMQFHVFATGLLMQTILVGN